MTTALFLLRAKELGLSLTELHELSMGGVFDMFTERANDSYEYKVLATQEDFDKFRGSNG